MEKKSSENTGEEVEGQSTDTGEVISIYEFKRRKRIKERRERRERTKREALASGVEPFSVDEALKYYRPDMALNEEQARDLMAGLEYNYYSSGERTLAEWGRKKEEYDVYKDSTGHDTY